MTPCKDHGLPYLAFHADAEERNRRGERQVWCSLCRRWTWPDHVSDDHRPHVSTKRQFDRVSRTITPKESPC